MRLKTVLSFNETQTGNNTGRKRNILKDESIREREPRGLNDACNRPRTIICLDQEGTLTYQGKTIRVVPAYKQFLK